MRKYLITQGGNFYKANLHCHTDLSDGGFSPEDVKKMYMEKCFGVNISILDNTYVDVFLQNEFFSSYYLCMCIFV